MTIGLYEPDDYDGEDTGDDRTRLVGKHTERECAHYRDEMARRLAFCQGLGVGREYLLLESAARRPALTGRQGKALPAAVPAGRLLPAPRTEDSAFSHSHEEDATQ